MAELKPCPFCGNTRTLESYQITPGWTDPYWHIGCPECGCMFEIAGWTEEQAVEAWNRRADDVNGLQAAARIVAGSDWAKQES